MADRRKALARREAMRHELLAAQAELRMLREEYGRYDRALDGLMRDVAAFVADPYLHPTSIFSGRLIKALAKASAEIGHG